MMTRKVVEFPGQRASVPISEDFIADIVAKEHGENIRWCPEHGRWYLWDGSFWKPDNAGQVFQMCRLVCRVYSSHTGKDKWGKFAAVSGVERFCRSTPGLYAMADDFDADPMTIGSPEGSIDLTTGWLGEPDRAQLITKSAAVVPTEPGSSGPPIWLKFLDEATSGNRDLIDFLQRMCGYALTGETVEQCLFFLYGPGGNGKTVFLNTLTGILGDYAKTAAMDTLNSSRSEKHSTDLAMLQGARVVASSETEEGQAWAEAKVKAMTGSDNITARFMRQDNFTYRPQFKLVVVGNHKPTINTVDDAIRRRFNIVPFINKPAFADPALERKMRDEWPAIFRWMIDGCVIWREQGLSRPDVVRVETASYFADQDLFQQWLDESCTVREGQWEVGAKLYDSYKRFIDAAGEPKIGRKTFTQTMRNRGFEPKLHTFYKTGVRLCIGLYLNSEGPKTDTLL